MPVGTRGKKREKSNLGAKKLTVADDKLDVMMGKMMRTYGASDDQRFPGDFA